MYSMAMLRTILNLHPPLRLEPLTTEVTPAGITFRGTEYNFCISRSTIPVAYWTAKGHLKPLTPLAQRDLIIQEIFKKKNYRFAHGLDLPPKTVPCKSRKNQVLQVCDCAAKAAGV